MAGKRRSGRSRKEQRRWSQGAQNCAQYARDAESAGDEELVQFLQECRTSHMELAAQAKQLLAARIDETDEDDDEGDDDED